MNTDQPTPANPAQDTPETDALTKTLAVRTADAQPGENWLEGLVPADHSRSLERQRNAALQQVRDLRAALEPLITYADLHAKKHEAQADSAAEYDDSVAFNKYIDIARSLNVMVAAARAALAKTEGVV